MHKIPQPMSCDQVLVYILLKILVSRVHNMQIHILTNIANYNFGIICQRRYHLII